VSVTLRRLLVLGGVVAAGALLLWWSARPQSLRVVLHVVGSGPVERVVANTKVGVVEAVRRAKLAPDTPGRVAVLNVKRNDRVAAGQVLLELWNEDVTASLALARAELQQAQAHHREAELAAELSQRDAARIEALREQSIKSEEVLDRAKTEAAVRRAAADEAGVAVQVAQSRVRVHEVALERTRLRAPFPGIIAEVNCELGEVVTPSPVGIPTPPTIDLIEEPHLRVAAPIDEVDVRDVRPDLPVRITLDAFPGQTLGGTVTRVAPYVTEREKEARTVDVEVAFAEPPPRLALRPGLSADVEIVLETRASVLRVPSAAVREGGKVLVAEDNAGELVLAERMLGAGFRNWQWTEVTSGVVAGDRIVVSLDRPGLAAGVRVVEEQPSRTGLGPAR
jgi:HlyD family secretion protein